VDIRRLGVTGKSYSIFSSESEEIQSEGTLVQSKGAFVRRGDIFRERE
jgi:hypothetical protein